jgi:uncharacterized protein GlcG (DUF336 family)
LSPSGGWNHIPRNWKDNTAIVLLGIVGVSVFGYAVGEKATYVSNTRVDDETIGRWNLAAKKAREAAAIEKASGSSGSAE